jgi:hypothetical protein
MKIWRKIQTESRKLAECWKMFQALWSVIPKDCHWALIEEFIFNPNALENRYHNEMLFQEELASRWTNV